eukprot:gene16985-20213_t
MSSSHKSGHTSKSSDSSGSLSRILNFSKSIEKGTFGVLYTMTKGNTFPKILTILSIIIEFIQLVSFGFKEIFPWGSTLGHYLQKIVSPISHPADSLAYTGFVVLFWVACGFMFAGLVTIWYVAYKFYQGEIANIWVIRGLRWFVSGTVAVLYIPIISLFLIGLNCERDPIDHHLDLARFPGQDIECFGDTNITVAIFSIVYMVLFTIIAVSSSVTYYEFDTNVKDRFSKPHARFDLSLLMVKTIFAFFFELLRPHPWLLAIVFFIGMLWVTFGSIIFLPYNNQRLNQIKSGLYMAVLWVALCTILTMIVNDKESGATAYLVIVGILPSFGVGFLVNRAFYRYLCRPLSKLGNLPSMGNNDHLQRIGTSINGEQSKGVTFDVDAGAIGSKKQINFPFFAKRFTFAFFVEIMSRRILKNRDAESIERANVLYQAGLQYFPNSSLLWMAYANYLFTVRHDRHIGYAALEKLRRMNPTFDVRFFIYQRDKEREQMMDSDLRGPNAGGKIQDFVSYMEFKKLYMGARKSHQSCLNYIRRFWRHLLHETIDLHRLSDLSGKIANSETKASEQYERLLGLNPNSVRVLRDYAQFVDEVVKDGDHAFRLKKKADLIEDTMSKSMSNEHIKNLDIQSISDDERLSMAEGGVVMDRLGGVVKDGSKQSKSGDDTSESSSSVKTNRYEAFQQSNSISKLSWLMIITTLISIVFTVTCLVVLRNQMVDQSYAFQGVLSLGEGAVEAVTVATTFNTFYQMGGRYNNNSSKGNGTWNSGWNSGNYTGGGGNGFSQRIFKSIDSMTRGLNILENIHHALYWGEKSPQAFVADRMADLKRQDGIKNIYDVGGKVFTFGEYNKSRPVNSPELMAIYNEPVIEMALLIAIDHQENVTVDYSYNNLTRQYYNAWKAVNLYVTNGRYAVTTIQEIAKNLTSNRNQTSPTATPLPTTSASDPTESPTTPHSGGGGGKGSGGGGYNMNRKWQKLLQDPYYRFVTDNGPRAVADLFLQLQMAYIETSGNKADTNSMNIIYIWLGIMMMLVLLGALLFRPVVSRISREKIRTLVLFSLAPKDLVQKMATKKVKMSSLDSGSDRDILFDTDDEVDRSTPEKPSLIISMNANANSPINMSKDDMRPLVGNSSDDTNDSPRKMPDDSNAPAIQCTGSGEETVVTMGAWDGKSKRSINKTSLRSVLRRLHYSYSFALFLLFAIMTMGLFVSFNEIYRDYDSGYVISLNSQRAVEARKINYYVSQMFRGSTWSGAQTLRNENTPEWLLNATVALQMSHQSLADLPNTRSLMDGTIGCWLINATQCRNSSDPYIQDVSNGLDWIVELFLQKAINLANSDKFDLVDNNTDWQWIQEVGMNDLYDGLDRANYDTFSYYQESQEKSILVITVIMSVSAILLLGIYVILFRTFIQRLRVQHIKTLAMLRMAPEDIQHMEVSDKIIDE